MTRPLPVPAHVEAGTGEAVVFLHGIGGNREAFAGQLPAFAERWRAVAWDMPGYGDSVLDPPMSFEMLADSLALLLDRLALPAAHVVGHSMGGMVAQSFVARYPERVVSLVLAGTSPAFGKPGGDWQKQFLSERLAPLERGLTPADFAERLVPSMFGDHATAEAVAAAARCMAALSAETYRAALECIVTFDGRAGLARIACPTLALAGERDGNAPAAVVQRMAEKIPGAEYVSMPGAGHLMNFECPDEFNRIVGDFIARHAATGDRP